METTFQVSYQVTLGGRLICLTDEFDSQAEAAAHIDLLLSEGIARNISLTEVA